MDKIIGGDMITYRGKRVILYGLGKEFYEKKEFLEKYFIVLGYTDKNKVDIEHYINANEIWKYEYDYIYVSTRKYYYEIRHELINSYCVRAENIISESDIWKEMFESGKMHFTVGKTVVDINVYNEDIYAPVYNQAGIMQHKEPDIYDNCGRKLHTYFLRDYHFAHTPYWTGKYFVWDRYNWGLDTHFYSHNAMKQTMGTPLRKYGLMTESKSIVPEDYKWLKNSREFCKEFDSIFTYDDELLESIPNAKFVPFCAEPWYGRNVRSANDSESQYLEKKRDVSILSSDKEMCEMHKLRKAIARKCKRENLADAYGTFDGGKYVAIEDTLSEYRYSIIIENDITKYFFTEKITSCFVAQTIPIYCGAESISEFFNVDGIIIVNKNDLNDIEKILKQCSQSAYLERLPAIMDNYNRVKEYMSCWDYMYTKYIKEKE